MSANIAKDTLVASFKSMLSCEGGVTPDFIIESDDGDGEKATLHVHSSVLTMRFDFYYLSICVYILSNVIVNS